MKTISIRELHTRTGYFVREAGESPIFVTERGRKIAMLIPMTDSSLIGISFPKRKMKDLISLKGNARDSAELISEDRDRK